MVHIEIPDSAALSEENRNYVEYFDKRLGHIPNLYLYMMHSAFAFDTFYTFHNRKTSLSLREREVISLVVAEVNKSLYCLSAHTMIAKLNGFDEEQIIQLRQGKAGFDPKLDALAGLVKRLAEKTDLGLTTELATFFEVGYTRENLLDVLQAIGENIISNLTAKTLTVPIDFPLAQALNEGGNK
jgi:AhpD family alkylhydroperoxidase